jgi:ribosomal protein L37AE/L43A
VSHRDDCPHCHAHASVERPSSAWWALHAAGWVYAFGSVLGASVTGPIIVGLLPPLFAGGTCLLAFSYARASAEPQCSVCGKMVIPAGRPAAAPSYDAVRQHA